MVFSMTNATGTSVSSFLILRLTPNAVRLIKGKI